MNVTRSTIISAPPARPFHASPDKSTTHSHVWKARDLCLIVTAVVRQNEEPNYSYSGWWIAALTSLIRALEDVLPVFDDEGDRGAR